MGDTRFWIGSTPEVPPFELRPEEQRLASELNLVLDAPNN